MQIDLLIGSDYVWEFFDGKTVWGQLGRSLNEGGMVNFGPNCESSEAETD